MTWGVWLSWCLLGLLLGLGLGLGSILAWSWLHPRRRLYRWLLRGHKVTPDPAHDLPAIIVDGRFRPAP